MVTRVIALGVALGLTVAGCSDIRRQATDALDSVASQAAGAPSKDTVERWNTDELTKALTAINDKIGASPADYLMFTISGYTSVAVQAIDPKKRENVDEYRYDGSSVKVRPVDVSRNEPGVVDESSFKSDIVTPAVLTSVLSSAVKDSGVQDGTVSVLTIEKFFANEPEPKIQVVVGSPRASKNVRYTPAGDFIETV
ncbi:hypothetical protein BKG83_02925 [Mycobacteroides chelonae]|uniref:hypothetical protein n=1 Tax=Mycobacteroides chelonae TaxID=1774 RepID=UPI0008A8A79F|nr:hypothetical protein [Mycobacteroides chelonae]OHU58918.1 hypothetical protein BKG83_02925 [Mycobacteroides chelonae]PKQ55840.1 hypothetical protein B5566_22985 [Mycobacterium sp. MHSD3]SKL97466.1 Uncharacterised protein [Mycobacteroides abscessus subsp. bolletii]